MKRFYKLAGILLAENGAGFKVVLDDKPIRTPAKNLLHVPSERLAQCIAGEWNAQKDEVDTAEMRLTRLANTAIDRVAEVREQVIGEIAGYARTDLVCYRADQPVDLVRRQAEAWEPLIKWISQAHGINLDVTTGLLPIDQSADCLAAVEAVVSGFTDFGLAGLHMVTTAIGSVVIGLAVAEQYLDGKEAWERSLVDELFQIEQWGDDPETQVRQKNLAADIDAAAEFLKLVKATP